MGAGRTGGFLCVRTVCSSLRVRFNNSLEQKVVHTLRTQVFAALQRLSLSYFENRSTGEIMTRVTSDTEHVERIFVDGLEEVLTASLTLVGITITLFTLNWKLALLSLLPIPLLIVSASWFTRRVHGYYHDIRSNGAVSTAISRMPCRASKRPSVLTSMTRAIRFERLSQEYSTMNLHAMYLWSVYSPGMVFVGSLGTLLILWYGAAEVLAGQLTVGQLVMFLTYLALFYTPINQIHSVNHMLQHALAASERVFEILDTPPEVQDRPGVVAPVRRLEGTSSSGRCRSSTAPDFRSYQTST